MRVYLPSTLSGLAGILRDRKLEPAPLTGYAVTPALREWYASADLEELEYAAMSDAARDSLRLLAADPEAPSRRVVIAAEVPDEAVVHAGGHLGDPGERARVRVTQPVPFERIVSGHVDDAEAETDVRAARAASDAADAGDDDARFTVDGAAGHELLWYATQELPHLLS
ncbi:DUF6912 family protein [Actinoallomurus iriomotensis]|uniref:Uncharacterized protein n=1 Tax=Actinoallomurus iriomotensis TaxID=478107 RepID=A0A9W6S8J2_9ACTN|nr:hypothetical protein [Actinoallomurus iriomotensis]GLY89024.1 hypothetical protein Airi02_069530 [Actinoallomurus iriomotensis]